MYGFRPARNRKHPGDPPPRWTPIGKHGRIVVLATVIVGIAIALVIMTTRTAGAADDTDGAATATDLSSPAESSERVEVREAGYAVTFPEDWAVEIIEEDSDMAILAFSPERFGSEVELRNMLVAWGPEGRGPERDTLNVCTLVRYEPIELTATEFMDEVFGQSEDLAVDSLREGLSRVFMNQFLSGLVITDQPEHLYIEHYAIGGDSVVAVLWCTGVLSHRGDWLSIAENFEFLPAEK